MKGTCEGPSGHTVSHFVSPVVSLVPSLVPSPRSDRVAPFGLLATRCMVRGVNDTSEEGTTEARIRLAKRLRGLGFQPLVSSGLMSSSFSCHSGPSVRFVTRSLPSHYAPQGGASPKGRALRDRSRSLRRGRVKWEVKPRRTTHGTDQITSGSSVPPLTPLISSPPFPCLGFRSFACGSLSTPFTMPPEAPGLRPEGGERDGGRNRSQTVSRQEERDREHHRL